MVELTRLNGEKIAVNPDLIEYVEATPDTVVTLTTGRKFLVRESVARISEAMERHKRRVYSNLKK
ncbi:MAG: flagellar FlbD family protein [Syntrophomonadaceae bacterium]|jgi:flagellar protein FlbD|nr:flagellar FlbD family protein [Syntrophomonadaceae bacterium]MDH7498115.1 flagellar FlbD family protein [Syntrophomonadaceae bacterium]